MSGGWWGPLFVRASWTPLSHCFPCPSLSLSQLSSFPYPKCKWKLKTEIYIYINENENEIETNKEREKEISNVVGCCKFDRVNHRPLSDSLSQTQTHHHLQLLLLLFPKLNSKSSPTSLSLSLCACFTTQIRQFNPVEKATAAAEFSRSRSTRPGCSRFWSVNARGCLRNRN